MHLVEALAATKRLAEKIWNRDREGVTALIRDLTPPDLHLIFSRLGSSDRSELLEILDPVDAANLLLNLKEPAPHTLLAQLSPEIAAEILRVLPSNIEADFISAMKPAAAKRILEQLPERELDDIRTLAQYSPDVAGGIMVTEILRFSDSATVRKVVDDLR